MIIKERLPIMAYLFITDIHHNYVCLRKEFKGLNFPRVELPPQHENKVLMLLEHMRVVDERLCAIFGKDVTYHVIDKVVRPGCVFYRVEMGGYAKECPSHSWYHLKEYKKIRTNTFVSNHVQYLRLPSSLVGAGTVITSTDGDYYLLVNGAVSMKYGVPKGHLGPGEDMIDAAVRETYEETGIHLERSQLNLVKSILYKKIRLFKVTIDRNEHPNPVPVDTCEISHAKWFHKTQIHHLHDMTQLTRSILIRRI